MSRAAYRPAKPLDGAIILPGLIRKNVAATAGTYVIAALSGLVAQIALARHLGRSTYGVYVAAVALVALVRVVSSVGGTEYVVRAGVRDSARLGELIGDVLVLKLAVAGAGLVLAVGAASMLGFGPLGIGVVALLAIMAGAEAAADALRDGLQTVERLERGAAISMSVAVLSAGGILLALARGWGLFGAIAMSTVVSAGAVPVAWALARRAVDVRVRLRARAVRAVLRASVPFAVIGVLGTGVTFVDALIVRAFLGDRATGLYGAAYRIIVVLSWVGIAYANAVYRMLADLAHRGRASFGPFVERSAAGLVMVGLPLALGGWVLGARILVLVFGEAYAPAAGAFRVLLLSLPFAFPGILLMTAVVTGERPRTAAWIFGGALAGNVALNLIAVPRWGITGAAWTTLATEAAVVVAASVALTRRGVRARWPALALPGLAAGALMLVVVIRVQDMRLAAPIVFGACVYAAGLLAMNVPARLGLRGRV